MNFPRLASVLLAFGLMLAPAAAQDSVVTTPTPDAPAQSVSPEASAPQAQSQPDEPAPTATEPEPAASPEAGSPATGEAVPPAPAGEPAQAQTEPGVDSVPQNPPVDGAAPQGASPGETDAVAEPASAIDDGAAARAEEADGWEHALSLMGEVKYPADFRHFDYVNPQAPKGGTARLSGFGGFDSFNPAIPRGVVASSIGLIYDTLMTSSYDEIATEYPLLAEAVRHPEDFSSVTYRLNANARWHDGEPVTVEDVIWSFEVLKENSPFYAYYYRNVTAAEKAGEREVTFRFDERGNRELPQIVGQLMVMPRHWWEGTDAQGRKRDITQTTLEAPLGSGAYRIKSFAAGRNIVYERVPDYWGADLPVNVGANNFGEIRYEYFRDMDVALEAFKADQYDFRLENSAKNWATGYEFPARKDGRVTLESYANRSSGIMQGFAFNLRREKFQDPRLRRAFDLVLNFQEMNRTLFFGQYQRIASYFQNTELASSGLPEGRELEILEEVRDEVPPEVFTTPYSSPAGGDQAAMRENMREASRLLADAGWTIRTEEDPENPPSMWTRILSTVGLGEVATRRILRNDKGQSLEVEFLLNQPNMERVVLFYKQYLDRLGVDVRVRTVDQAQYENRVNARDYDVVVSSWPQSLSPGNEQRDFWGSAAADREGSRNLVGIKNPAIDKLIERVIYATDREDLVAATHALDRVLLWNHYVVPQWTSADYWVAFWNRFSHPDPLPEYSFAFPTIWWWDEAKASAVRVRQ